MQYDGRFRFKSIAPKRFYDAPMVGFIVGVLALVVVQAGLLVAGKPDIRTYLKEKGAAFVQMARAVQAGGHDQN